MPEFLFAKETFDRWPELYRMLMDAFAYMAGRIDPPSSLLRMDVDALAEKAKVEKLALALDRDRIVGCAFFRIETDTVYFGKLAVAESHRGQGIARELLHMAERLAVAEGKACLELQTSIELTENHAAFSRLGFLKVCEQTHEGFNRPTSIAMRRRVARAESASEFAEQSPCDLNQAPVLSAQ